jgi:DNA mismatch endonuclease (patch repair protein)
MPVQNRSYWSRKIARTAERDEAAEAALTALGWKVSVFWECELKNEKRVARRLRAFLG